MHQTTSRSRATWEQPHLQPLDKSTSQTLFLSAHHQAVRTQSFAPAPWNSRPGGTCFGVTQIWGQWHKLLHTEVLQQTKGAWAHTAAPWGTITGHQLK